MWIPLYLLPFPNQFARTVTTPGQPVDWKAPLRTWRVDHQLVDMQSHLQGDQVPVALDSHSVSKPKEEDADSAEEHSTTEEVAEVHPLGHPATDKHEDGVREQVGGVKDGQHVLGFCCTCSINLEVWRHKGDL